MADANIGECWDGEVVEGTVPSNMHNELLGRDAADCHPIAAITGLQTELDTLANHTHSLDDISDNGTMAYQDDAPVDGTEYVRKDSNWVLATPQLPAAHTHPLAEITDSGALAAEADAPIDGQTYLRKDGAWIVGSGGAPDAHTHPLAEITDNGSMAFADDALIDGQEYVRKDGGWVLSANEHTHPLLEITDNGSLAYVDDAVSDGKVYARQNGSWSEITAPDSGGGWPYIIVLPLDFTPGPGGVSWNDSVDISLIDTLFIDPVDGNGINRDAAFDALLVGDTLRIYLAADTGQYANFVMREVGDTGNQAERRITFVDQAGSPFVDGDEVLILLSAGNVSTEDNTTQQAIVSVYTTGAGNHTFHADTVWAKVTVTGGGQGGRSASDNSIAGGGSSGGSAVKCFAVIGGGTGTYVVGAGGARNLTSGAGSAGSASTFSHNGSVLTGGGGVVAGIGDASGGDINVKGGEGSYLSDLQLNGILYATGGASIWGGGTHPDQGTDGAYGAGGSGQIGSIQLSVDGEAGVVYIEEYR